MIGSGAGYPQHILENNKEK